MTDIIPWYRVGDPEKKEDETEPKEKEYVVMVERQGFATIKAKGKADLDKKVEALGLHDFDWEPLFDMEYCVIEEREVRQ